MPKTAQSYTSRLRRRQDSISAAAPYVSTAHWVTAHNPAGARSLAAYIQRFFADEPVRIVYGAMRDKAIGEVTNLLFPLAAELVLTAPDQPRALNPAALLQRKSSNQFAPTETDNFWAMSRAITSTGPPAPNGTISLIGLLG